MTGGNAFINLSTKIESGYVGSHVLLMLDQTVVWLQWLCSLTKSDNNKKMSEKYLSEFRICIVILIVCKQPQKNKTWNCVLLNRETKLKIMKQIETHHFSGQCETLS